MKGLSFSALRAANIARLPEFKDAHGRPAHSATDDSDWERSAWLEALVGELGEYANLSKKVRRGDLTMAEALPHLRDELADVTTYLDILAFQLGIDLGEAAKGKFNRVSERVGSSVRLADSGWYRSDLPKDEGR